MAAKPERWFSTMLDTRRLQAHFYRAGSCKKPSVVFAHGMSDNGLCWRRVAEALQPDYDLILPDARGHGLSPAVSPGHGLSLVEDLATLIDALDLDGTVIVGHSMGAATGAEVAACYPELVKGLVLEDPPWLENEIIRDFHITFDLREYGAYIAGVKAQTLEEIAAEGRKNNPTWDEVELEAWALSKLQNDPNFYSEPLRFRSWRETAPRIHCPTLMITADPALGGLVTPAVAAEVQRLNRRMEVKNLPGAGHNIRREQFEGYLQTLRAFLNRIYS